MPSVHANRRSNAPNESRGRPVVLASLLLALLLGLVSAGAWWGGWFGVKEDPRLTEVKTVMADAAAKYPPDQAPKNMLETAARVGAMVSVMAKIQSLPEDLRPKAMEEGRKLMMKGMEARVDSYFAAPPDQRQKLIDDQLKQMQSMQKAFEGSRSMFQGRGQGGSGGAAGNQQAAGRPGPRSEEDRSAWRKRMIDGSSPSQRARWTEYFGEVEKRRQALGMGGGGGPFGPR
jgi:hypothetical protein